MTERWASSGADHRDVAAYALGLLNPRAAAEFEDHLSGCDLCAAELGEFSRLSAVLADADVDALLAPDRPGVDDRPHPQRERQLDVLLGAVADERRKTTAHRLYAAAAAVLLVAAGTVGGLVVGGRDQSGTPPVALPTTAASAVATTPAGQEYRATDPLSRVDARIWLEPKKWGTQVTLMLGNVKGPLECRLVAVAKSGTRDVAMAWTVPPEGYGTAAQPMPLTVRGGTAVQRADIDHFEVRTVDDAIPTGGTTLVYLTLN